VSANAAAVEAIVDAGGPVLREAMARVEERLAQVAGEGGDELAGHARATVAAGGKRLRPLLVHLAAGPAAERESVLRAAVAVELIHAATLVHDDILDAAPLRRGRATVVASAGRQMATATGDLLFARAFAELARNGRADELRSLSAASSALARGELLQREDAWRADVTVERYLHRCELKTGSLFGAACELGALEAEPHGELPGTLASFGRRVGLAFQLLDDVLDVSGVPAQTGKPRGTDLLDGTVTLPLIVARERDAVLAALDLRSVEGPQAAAAVCERIEATGAPDLARARALELVERAKRELPAGLGTEQRRALKLVADGVARRSA
jgi:geranylgeranyl pyrophosphate synthase